jgi:hypothetical protein
LEVCLFIPEEPSKVEDDFGTRVISYPTFTELNDILSSYFDVTATALEYGMPTFAFRWHGGHVPEQEEQERVFSEVGERAEKLRVWPVVRWRNKRAGEYVVRFVPEQKAGKSDITINYALFIATLGTISLAGFLQASSEVFLSIFFPLGWTVLDIAMTTGLFVLALMGIIGTHEAGHYFAAKRRGIDATPPYFIPGIPDIGGTFGAFIQQKSPPMRRKDLFDLGVAGPLAGFAVTIVVLVAGFLMSVPLTSEQLAAIEATFPAQTGSLPVPLLFIFIEIVFAGFIPPGGTLYMHPVAFASWVGMLVTALNLFPTGQLDGGHALRAIVDNQVHKYIGWAAIAIMFLMRLWLMAILVLALSMGGGHPGALNETVPVSKGRVALFIVCMIILVICMPPLWDIGLF